MFTITSGQKNALAKSIEWYFSTDFDKKSIFIIAGYAGCGKTTIVKLMTELLGLSKNQVIYTAYTGKAVNVLRSKGNYANTIHKTFYNIYKSSNGKYTFKLKKELQRSVELIVIDEFSMLNDKFINDILSFNLPVVALGDPGQLTPIFGHNSYISNSDNIDVFLTEVMRQDSSSGILDLATMARNNEYIPYGNYKKSKVIRIDEVDKLENYDMVLCYTNSTRRHLNSIIRKKLNYNSLLPLKNEKIICLKNNYYHSIEYKDLIIMPVNGLTCISLTDGICNNIDSNVFKLR